MDNDETDRRRSLKITDNLRRGWPVAMDQDLLVSRLLANTPTSDATRPRPIRAAVSRSLKEPRRANCAHSKPSENTTFHVVQRLQLVLHLFSSLARC